VEVLQPRAVGNVRAPSRDVFDVLCVDEIDLQPTSFQDLHQRNPVNSGGVHGNRADSILPQPIAEMVQIVCERGEHTNRLGISVSRYCNVNLRRADIDSGGIGIQSGRGNPLVLFA